MDRETVTDRGHGREFLTVSFPSCLHIPSVAIMSWDARYKKTRGSLGVSRWGPVLIFHNPIITKRSNVYDATLDLYGTGRSGRTGNNNLATKAVTKPEKSTIILYGTLLGTTGTIGKKRTRQGTHPTALLAHHVSRGCSNVQCRPRTALRSCHPTISRFSTACLTSTMHLQCINSHFTTTPAK